MEPEHIAEIDDAQQSLLPMLQEVFARFQWTEKRRVAHQKLYFGNFPQLPDTFIHFEERPPDGAFAHLTVLGKNVASTDAIGLSSREVAHYLSGQLKALAVRFQLLV